MNTKSRPIYIGSRKMTTGGNGNVSEDDHSEHPHIKSSAHSVSAGKKPSSLVSKSSDTVFATEDLIRSIEQASLADRAYRGHNCNSEAQTPENTPTVLLVPKGHPGSAGNRSPGHEQQETLGKHKKIERSQSDPSGTLSLHETDASRLSLRTRTFKLHAENTIAVTHDSELIKPSKFALKTPTRRTRVLTSPIGASSRRSLLKQAEEHSSLDVLDVATVSWNTAPFFMSSDESSEAGSPDPGGLVASPTTSPSSEMGTPRTAGLVFENFYKHSQNRLNSLERERNALVEECEKNEVARAELLHDKSLMEEQIKKLQDEQIVNQARIDKLVSSGNDDFDYIAKYEQDLNASREQSNKQALTIGALEKKIKGKSSDIKGLEGTLDVLRKEKDQLATDLEKTNQALNKANDQMVGLQKALKELDVSNSSLRNEVLDKQARISTLTDDLQSARVQIDDLFEDKAELQAELDEIIPDIEELDKLHQHVQEMDEQLRKFQENDHELRDQLDQRNDDFVKQKQLACRLESQNAELIRRVQPESRTPNGLEAEISPLAPKPDEIITQYDDRIRFDLESELANHLKDDVLDDHVEEDHDKVLTEKVDKIAASAVSTPSPIVATADGQPRSKPFQSDSQRKGILETGEYSITPTREGFETPVAQAELLDFAPLSCTINHQPQPARTEAATVRRLELDCGTQTRPASPDIIPRTSTMARLESGGSHVQIGQHWPARLLRNMRRPLFTFTPRPEHSKPNAARIDILFALLQSLTPNLAQLTFLALVLLFILPYVLDYIALGSARDAWALVNDSTQTTYLFEDAQRTQSWLPLPLTALFNLTIMIFEVLVRVVTLGLFGQHDMNGFVHQLETRLIGLDMSPLGS